MQHFTNGAKILAVTFLQVVLVHTVNILTDRTSLQELGMFSSMLSRRPLKYFVASHLMHFFLL